MSERDVWDTGRNIAIQACYRVLKRHGLVDEADQEVKSLRAAMKASAQAESAQNEPGA